MDGIRGFDWDAGNQAKCTSHGVSVAEIESVFEAAVILIPDPAHSVAEPRMRAIGRATSGRHVFVVFTIRSRGSGDFVRPISARYMHRKEVTAYEEANPGVEKGTDIQD